MYDKCTIELISTLYIILAAFRVLLARVSEVCVNAPSGEVNPGFVKGSPIGWGPP